MTVAGDILREAAGIVEGARNETHGAPERCFFVIARFWRVYVDELTAAGKKIRDQDVSQMMALLKIARALAGDETNPDHALDQVGYSAITGELRS